MATAGNGIARGETLTQYGKALRALRKSIEQPSHERTRTALACCILFYCFEAALGNSEAAMHHLQSGLGLLATYQRDQKHRESDDLYALSRVFDVLDLQATLFHDERIPFLVLTTEEERETGMSDLLCTDGFTRFDDAYQALVKLQNWLFHFLTKNMPYKSHTGEATLAPILEEKGCLTKWFDRWMTKFDNLKNQTGQSDQMACGTQTLLIHWQVSCMLLEADYPTDESVFGASPNLRAEEVLSLASNMLESTAKENGVAEIAKGPRRKFSSETGVIAPLFTLAMKCSDEHVCNRATELLANSQRREGLYDAGSMATIIHQFKMARQQKEVRSEGYGVEEIGNISLEKMFALELDSVTGGMDKMAKFTKPTT
ncbi:hypothetical protein N0V83_004214 [Neocucurbitaria cava]|uniref:Uncharacterized protein n=1 Tax=Neocucurbitaria cava TaxID=798079 RepID=A0A9W8YAY2_9PLEO|nr:hypothetical protein N0V83_004214 [Neocucurbitaria cava]